MSKFGSRISKECELWGEISNRHECVVSEDVCETVIMGAVKPEDPKLRLPVTEDDDDSLISLPAHLTKPNEIIRHTIRLNQHAKAMEKLFRSPPVMKTDLKKCHPIPEEVISERDIKPPELKGAFELGQGHELPQLETNTVDHMIQKAVIVILAQVGFDKAEKSALHTLSDIVRYILTHLTRLLHEYSERDLTEGRVNYTDVVEKALQTVGLKGVKSIEEYWQNQVIHQRDKALLKSTLLMASYNKLISKPIIQSQPVEMNLKQEPVEAVSGPVQTTEPPKRKTASTSQQKKKKSKS